MSDDHYVERVLVAVRKAGAQGAGLRDTQRVAKTGTKRVRATLEALVTEGLIEPAGTGTTWKREPLYRGAPPHADDQDRIDRVVLLLKGK